MSLPAYSITMIINLWRVMIFWVEKLKCCTIKATAIYETNFDLWHSKKLIPFHQWCTMVMEFLVCHSKTVIGFILVSPLAVYLWLHVTCSQTAGEWRHEMFTFDPDAKATSWTCCSVAACHVNHHFCDQSYINLFNLDFHNLNIDIRTTESGHTYLCNILYWTGYLTWLVCHTCFLNLV